MSASAADDDAPPLHGADFDRDPSTAYRWLQQHSPMHRIEFPGLTAWLVTRYEDAVAALSDPLLAKDPARASAQWRSSGMGLPYDHRASLVNSLINTDPPDHTRMRRVLGAAFSPRRMRELRGTAQQVTDTLLDRVAEHGGRADLIADLAYPLPIAIICDLLGVPESDRELLHSQAMVIDSAGPDSHAEIAAATDALDAFVADLVARKTADPGQDLLSDLVAQRATGQLSTNEVTSTAFLLLIAGHETTVAGIGNALFALLTHPELASRVRADATVVPAVVEESLRYDSPVRNATWRFPVTDTVVAGQHVRAGDPILVSVAAANRDPSVFPTPEEFDPGRDTGRHLAFGHGPHTCIGAALARMETEIAVTSVLTRFPALALVEPVEALTWWPSPIMRGLFRLPVAT
ncbi:cytochrome P450 [Solihabitans fulvus]|uniref:Cytochrome P450 n=1 Tax=Solihabitans fulvus TaxID=1892852 RepID=A0A5B2W5C8_9PSEU|nr:cytochrome P450 [Solihabitans fulvus]KAA2247173.1 cytochrome P450 [Solihabitans fulvus]